MSKRKRVHFVTPDASVYLQLALADHVSMPDTALGASQVLTKLSQPLQETGTTIFPFL